ncbi:UDP-N-acetylglucosamine 1-carboxyvinyltransferase, partial [Candidatus Saccharibacteria bacterium]|nr:UDP-N-acetylglucosamine 1-carboxyvinyltransferase [Candidatus Saccharibacteria bacterium]
YLSEDPIEAMSFIAAALVTKSEMTILRAPIEFLEIELEVLKNMNAKIINSPEYYSLNKQTRLVDLTIKKSDLVAPVDKIHPMPFPGLNIDNLPFFSVIAAVAKGRTLIHDWVFENRAVYITELSNLNAKVELLDAHRVYIEGPTNWRSADLTAPQALRPAVVVLIGMLAAPGTSILRNVYPINRGYQDFAARLRHLGADIVPLTGI